MQMVTERQRGESNNPAIGAASDMYMPPSYDDVKSNGGSQQISGTPGSKSQKALYFLAEVQLNYLLLTELICLLYEQFRPSRVSYDGVLSVSLRNYIRLHFELKKHNILVKMHIFLYISMARYFCVQY
jgi:hypothetical protein